MADPYQILGVPKTATAAEIKSAYRKLAKKLHPDVNPGKKDIEQKFKEVTAAYDLLSDAGKRAQFDRGEIDAQGQQRGFGGGGNYGGGGFGGFGRGARGPQGGGGGEDPFSQFGGMEDIFAEFMGGTARGRRGAGAGPVRGSDVTYTLGVSFVEAALGGKKRVTLTNDKTVDVTIPPGTEEGHKLRLKGQGLAGMGEAGDAIVEIHIEAHPFFTRKDHDIYQDVAISLPEAISGASVNVATLDGQVAVKVPKGANTGTTLRLKGKGVGGAKPGDMFVKLKIMLPEPVPQDLTDIIEKWAKKNAYNPRK
ncbi:MAG: J domain-containing protein [Alphaproteobacteria bacterium]|nr:J domain-containing protein [Alphaproteobacteria bacterium]